MKIIQFKKNATIAVLLKYRIDFWQSLEMPLIYWKVELKIRWMKNCVLVAACVGNDSVDPNNTFLTIKDAKLYFPVVTLTAAKDDQKLSKPISKGFERSVYWTEFKTKSENKKYDKWV